MQIDPENERMSKIMTEEELKHSDFISQHPVIAHSDDLDQLEKLKKDLEKAGYKVK